MVVAGRHTGSRIRLDAKQAQVDDSRALPIANKGGGDRTAAERACIPARSPGNGRPYQIASQLTARQLDG